jgi:hypothetical protein
VGVGFIASCQSEALVLSRRDNWIMVTKYSCNYLERDCSAW